MAWVTGTSTDAADFLADLVTAMTANGWTLEGMSTSTEKYLKSTGAGVGDFWIGLKLNSSGSLYWITINAYTGLIGSNTFYTHPGNIGGAYLPCIQLWNNSMPYWLQVNARRISGVVKVGGSTYQPFYAGLILPDGLPSEWPLPIAVGGSSYSSSSDTVILGYTDSTARTTGYMIPYTSTVDSIQNASPLRLRDQAGVWHDLRFPTVVSASKLVNIKGTMPYGAQWANNAALRTWRPLLIAGVDGKRPLVPVELVNDSPANRYGYFDGVFFVPGHNLTAETPITGDDTKTYHAFPNIARTANQDWFALCQE